MRDSTHEETQNFPSSSFWICTDQPPKQHETERTVTKTNAIVKYAEKNPLFAILLFFISFTKYKSFFSTKLLPCSFSLVSFRATVSLIFPYTADIDYVLFLKGKIPTKLKRINSESSANVLKCLLILSLFNETNLKSKRYTIHQYKRSFLPRSNVHKKLHHFCNTSSPDDEPRLGRSYQGNN